MTDFLVKRFIKNHDDIKNAEVRQAYGMLSGLVGIACNMLLFTGKLLAGSLSGSIAIVADAFNNLSDAGSSVVTLIGFRMAGQKADKDHPFGHGRIEYLAGLLVAFAILLVGVELLKTSVDKVLRPAPVVFSLLSVCILAAAILVKLWMFLFNRRLGKRIDSPAMMATATDSLSDVVATSTVLVCTVLAHVTGVTIDGFAGLAVSLFILYAGFRAVKDTLNPLLGAPPDPEKVKEIEETVMAHTEILGIHDLIIHDYGPGRSMISLHAEVSGQEDVMYLHDTIDAIERELREKFSFDAVIHMDPIASDNEQIKALRTKVGELMQEIHQDITIHDFRMTAGPMHTNLIFDVVVPFEVKLTEEELRKQVQQKVRTLGETYYAVVEIDHSYV